MRLAFSRRVVSTSHTATFWVSFLFKKPSIKPRPCVATPMKPRLSRSLGLISAPQICEGKRKGPSALTGVVDLRKQRRLSLFVVFIGIAYPLFLRLSQERLWISR